MIVLALACSPLDRDEVLSVEPGSYGVSVPLRTAVYLPEGAAEEAVEVTLRARAASDSIEAIDRFGVVRDLTLVDRVYDVSFDVETLAQPAWIGRWDPDAEGALFTVVQGEEGWSAHGWYEAPAIEVDAVLLHPGRSWFPTTVDLVHGTATE